MEILSGLAPEYAQGIYATPGTHDALIRFSNGSPHAGADARLGAATGLALKIFDIPGPTLLDDEPDTGTFDYANINGPVFFSNTVEHYLFIQELFLDAPDYFSQGRPGARRFFTDFVTGKGTLDQDNWAWDEFLAFLRLSKIPPVNVLLSSYWTMGAVRHGDHIAKVRITPEPSSAAAVVRRTIDPTSAAEVFRPLWKPSYRSGPTPSTSRYSSAPTWSGCRWRTPLWSGPSSSRRPSPWPDCGCRSRTSPARRTWRRWTHCPSHPGGSPPSTRPWATSCGPARRSTGTPPSSVTSSTSSRAQSPAAPTRYLARPNEADCVHLSFPS
ncbi:hypothetical protein ACFQ51_14655 [Streptomyces kaempferi]